MKKIYFSYLLSLLIGLSQIVNAQAPAWLWAKSSQGSGIDNATQVSIDASGNVFITGHYQSSTITFGATTLINAGGDDIFLVKYDGAGNVLWAKRAGGSGIDVAYSVSTDASGNAFVAGYFNSDSLALGTDTLILAGGNDIFLAKYDSSGNVLWAKRAGGTLSEGAYDVSTDAGGNVFVTGGFSSATMTFGTTTLTNAGTADIFVVKYDGSGNVLWAKSAGVTGDDEGYSVSTDANGNVFVTGWFSSATITFGTTTLTNAGSVDIFVAKYDSSGNVLWAKSAGGTFDDHGACVSTDASGNVFVTGNFISSAITFGTTTLTNPNAGSSDIFIAKYDSSGNVLWAIRAGGSDYDFGNSVSADASGNVLMTGFFSSPTITFGTATLTSPDNYLYIFVVKYDASGTVLWAIRAGNALSNSDGVSVSADANSNAIVTGGFQGPAITFGATTLNNPGGSDIFVAKLNNITGIEENVKNDGVRIFPNPGSRQINITSSSSILEINVTTLLGQVVFETKPNANNFSLQLDAQGIYFIQLTMSEQIITKKIIVYK